MEENSDFSETKALHNETDRISQTWKQKRLRTRESKLEIIKS